MKYCLDCGLPLPENKHRRGRKPSRCLICKKKYINKYYNKYYKEDHPSYHKEYQREKTNYYEKERHPIKKMTKEEFKIYQHNSYIKRRNCGKIKLARDKYYSNPQHKMANNLRNRIWCSLNRITIKSKKFFKFWDVIGCSPEELKIYLESQFKQGMTWDNYGRNGWHIDHIIPCILFDLTDPEQQKKCFHYTNLQPMWALDNIKKGKKIM